MTLENLYKIKQLKQEVPDDQTRNSRLRRLVLAEGVTQQHG